MRALLLAGLLAVGLLAGCIAPTVPVRDPAWAVHAIFGHALPADTGGEVPREHDHTNRSQHQGFSTPNFELLGHDPLLSPYFGATAGTGYCGDVSEAKPGARQ